MVKTCEIRLTGEYDVIIVEHRQSYMVSFKKLSNAISELKQKTYDDGIEEVRIYKSPEGVFTTSCFDHLVYWWEKEKGFWNNVKENNVSIRDKEIIIT